MPRRSRPVDHRGVIPQCQPATVISLLSHRHSQRNINFHAKSNDAIMDTLHKAFFSIFMITWGILMIVNIASICGRTARTFGRLRFWSFIPLWLYGPLVVLNPWWRLGHLDRGHQFLVS